MSRTFFSALLIAASVCLFAPRGEAFSLLGIQDASQTPALGYPPTELGGPRNLGEEYRITVPVVYYGFDSSFLQYFGQQGVRDIEEAFRILNNLPPVSRMSANLAEFPLNTTRENFQASALGLLDLKSTALNVLMSQMGLAEPEQWTWALRARITFTSGNQTFTNYLVIQRNFDPITFEPTNRVNEAIYGYRIVEPIRTGTSDADAIEYVKNDPLSRFNSVAGNLPRDGEFFTGLTRDDAGGLRYLLRKNNYNVERLQSDIEIMSSSAVAAMSPWGAYGVTNSFSPAQFGPGGGPWSTPGTNVVTNSNGTVVTNNGVTVGIRPGRDKITFVRADFDSLIGQMFVPRTNTFTDTVITNFVVVRQRLRRPILEPDIIFTAGDLGLAPNSATPILLRYPGVSNFENYGDVNSRRGDQPGPGGIVYGANGAALISFTTLFPSQQNQSGPGFSFLDDESSFFINAWGSFNNTSDPPIVYPNASSVADLENRVLR